MPSAQDLLLHLRCHAPHLARRLDGVIGLGVTRGVLTAKTSGEDWCAGELRRLAPELEAHAGAVFGTPVRLALDAGARPRPLPLPVAATKHWNHVAFLAATANAAAAVALPKPRYLEGWLPTGAAPEAEDGDGVLRRRYPAPAGTGCAAEALLAALPALADDLAALARAGRSYAQLLLPFPGDPAADRLEARLYGIKEWGTPRTPGPVLHRYLGRLHYLAPDAAPLGTVLARQLAAGR